MGPPTREHLWVVGLVDNLKILFIELVSLGTANSTIVEPMEVFSVALQKRAVSIILVQNHPSGELRPSKNDMDVTDRLIQVGKIVNTPVFDHLIITEESFTSFKDTGLMHKLEQSTKYVAPYQLAERMKNEMLAEAEQRAAAEAKQENTWHLAREMKRNGIADELIANMTQLSLEEIKGL
ncbi:MAG: JAB domain-containing protein [Bacteroidota bacterium]